MGWHCFTKSDATVDARLLLLLLVMMMMVVVVMMMMTTTMLLLRLLLLLLMMMMVVVVVVVMMMMTTTKAKFAKKNKNFDRRLLSTILDSGTRPYMPGKRATSRVERAIMLLKALKPYRMGAEQARLLNKEQRYPFVVSQSLTHSLRDQISCVLHTTN